MAGHPQFLPSHHQTPTRRPRRRLGLCAIILLVALLACNYPQTAATPPALDLQGIVRQTQTAAAAKTALPTLTPAGAPTGVTQPPATVAALPPAASTPDLSLPWPADRLVYRTMPGDTLAGLAGRFGVSADQITSDQAIPAGGFLPTGQALVIPTDGLPAAGLLSAAAALPDAEVVYSPAARDFSTADFIQAAGGFLSRYREEVDGETLSGAQIVERLALENSVDPRLLLAILEYRSGWVFSGDVPAAQQAYPLGYHVTDYQGLYKELSLAAKLLGRGYYGWRSGSYIRLSFADGASARLDPRLNAGSVAVQSLIASLYAFGDWSAALYGPDGFLARYSAWFGDPWARAAAVEPLFPTGIAAPELALPFAAGERWSLTGGPHTAWLTYTPRGALDFAPVTGEAPCAVSRAWVTASAAGIVARSDHNVVALDLDGDGFEGTGWVLIYLHLADEERIAPGTRVEEGDRLGHPSCEGGEATGTHVHLARKFNGEWLAADGPLPFILSGWQVHAGERNYQGALERGGEVVTAQPGGSQSSLIVRDR